jgi:hypothetical protein
LEYVRIVVDDLAAATTFFVELGRKVLGEGPVEGGWGGGGGKAPPKHAGYAPSHSPSMTSTPPSPGCKPAEQIG